MYLLTGKQLPWNFSWVDEKILAGSSVPTTEGQMKALVAEGICHLVSLSPEDPPFTRENKSVEGLKITYIGVEDFEAPTPKQIRRFLKVCESAHARGEAVAVHCARGRGRTGTVSENINFRLLQCKVTFQMLAAYFMWKENLDAIAAVTLVRKVRPGTVECKKQFEALLKLQRWISWGGAAFYGRFLIPDQMCSIL